MKIKRKDYEELVNENKYLKGIANARLTLSCPDPVGNILDVTLEQLVLIKRFGAFSGYDKYIYSVYTGQQMATDILEMTYYGPLRMNVEDTQSANNSLTV
jgi:hypothetical protein